MSQKIILIFIFIQIIYQIKTSYKFPYEEVDFEIYPNIIKLLSSLNISNNKTRLNKISKLRGLLLEEGEERDNHLPTFLFEIFDAFAFFLDSYKLTKLLDKEEVETCFFDGLLENINNKNLINIFIDGSGKSLNDFGNEFICDYNIRRNVSYMTLHFYLSGNNNTMITYKELFFNQRYFYIGLCLPRKCVNAIKLLINEESILKMCNEVNLGNLKLYVNEEVVEKSEQISGFYNFIIWIYIILNIIKIIVGICRVIFMNKGYEGFYGEKLKREETSSIFSEINNNGYSDESMSERSNKTSMHSQNSMDPATSYNIDINENIVSEGEILYNPISDNEKKYPNWLKFVKIFDLFDNIKLLSTNSNKYYTSQRIKNLYIIRFFLMLMIVVYQFMYTQTILPSKNFYNADFYSSPGFTIVKLCINSSTFWITLDAVIFGYKLMSYLKKEMKLSKFNQVKYSSFIKFLLLIIPKFWVFLFAFILLHLFSSRLTFQLCKGNKVYSNYLYYNDTVQQLTYSIRNNNKPIDFFKNFIPFRLNYIDFIENVTIEKYPGNITTIISDPSGYEIPSPFLKNTDLFVNVCFNEFYLIILMIHITYFSYVLKNKIFDFVILIINAILFVFPLIEAFNPHKGNFEDQDYTLPYVLGQNYTEKFTHYSLNFFYFGFIIGVMKFYHEQNIYQSKKKKKAKFNIDLPYDFFKKIITSLNGLKFCIKRGILLTCVALIFINAYSFNLIQGKSLSYDEDVNFPKIEGIVKFIFFYEKNLSGIFFFIFLLMYIIYPKNTYIMKIAESSTFIIVERISFCFFNSFSYLIYSQFSFFIISIQMSYSNLLYNTIGMFFIIFVFSLLNTALIELPVRQLIKYLMNKNLEKNFLTFFENHYSSSSSFSSDESSENFAKDDEKLD